MGGWGLEWRTDLTWINDVRVCVCVCVLCVCSDETHGDRAKESIRGKCSRYLERAEQLKKHLSKGKGKVHSSGPTASKEKKK